MSKSDRSFSRFIDHSLGYPLQLFLILKEVVGLSTPVHVHSDSMSNMDAQNANNGAWAATRGKAPEPVTPQQAARHPYSTVHEAHTRPTATLAPPSAGFDTPFINFDNSPDTGFTHYVCAPSIANESALTSNKIEPLSEADLRLIAAFCPSQETTAMSGVSDTGYFSQQDSSFAPSTSATGYSTLESNAMPTASGFRSHDINKRLFGSAVPAVDVSGFNQGFNAVQTPVSRPAPGLRKISGALKRRQQDLSMTGASPDGQPVPKQLKSEAEASGIISEADKESMLETWLCICSSQGRDPIEDDRKVEALATLLGMSQAKIGRWFGTHAPSVGLAQQQGNIVSDVPASESTDQRRMRHVQDFVTKARSTPCPANAPVQPKGGPLKCTWGCSFSHHRSFEWVRHEELRQPQNFWLCADCFEAAVTQPFITGRHDKLLAHARQRHRYEEAQALDLRARSRVIYDAGFDRSCTYRSGPEDTVCGYLFTGTWQQRNLHWLQHFQRDPNDGDNGLTLGSFGNGANGDFSSGGQGDTSGSWFHPKHMGSSGSFADNQDSKHGPNDHSSFAGNYDNCMSSFSDQDDPPAFLVDVRQGQVVKATASMKYLALSYNLMCDRTPASTVLPILSRMKNDVALNELRTWSPPFLKALQLTRDMGYGYVWIDFVCQSQASEAETERAFEGAVMIIVMACCPEVENQIWHFTCPYSKLVTVRKWMEEKISLHHVQTLGHGAYGIVDEVRLLPAKENFARKILFRSNSQEVPPNWKPQELEVMQKLNRLDHPHIARFVAAYYDSRALNILMLPVAECDLRQFLAAPERWPSKRSHLGRWFLSLASALDYMHTVSCRHKDIKPANILISGSEVVLTDFGTSLDFSSSISSSSGSAFMTPKYCAPEVARHVARGRSADVFSLGCVFVEMITVDLGKTLGDLNEYLGVYDESWRQKITYHQQIYGLREWLKELKLFVSTDYQTTILGLCFEMISSNPRRRPKARGIVERLWMHRMCAQPLDTYTCQCCLVSTLGLREFDQRKPRKDWRSKLDNARSAALTKVSAQQKIWKPSPSWLPRFGSSTKAFYFSITTVHRHLVTSYNAQTWSWSYTTLSQGAQKNRQLVISQGLWLLRSARALGKGVQSHSRRLLSAMQHGTAHTSYSLSAVTLSYNKPTKTQRFDAAKLRKAVRKISNALTFTMSCRHGSDTVEIRLSPSPYIALDPLSEKAISAAGYSDGAERSPTVPSRVGCAQPDEVVDDGKDSMHGVVGDEHAISVGDLGMVSIKDVFAALARHKRCTCHDGVLPSDYSYPLSPHISSSSTSDSMHIDYCNSDDGTSSISSLSMQSYSTSSVASGPADDDICYPMQWSLNAGSIMSEGSLKTNGAIDMW